MCSEYNRQLDRQIRRLETQSLPDIERETALKRKRWLEDNRSLIPPANLANPREAFELLFFTYMDLAPGDLMIVSEDEVHITWLSLNPCPTLDACKALGLDTRKVCRQAYEKSTQAFLSMIDPQLRFIRSYEKIRPYAEACLETIRRVDFEGMMRIAINEAQTSRREGNKGYGAVIAKGNQALARAHDLASVMKDPSLHAEVNAIRAAVRKTGDADLCGSVLFSTCEPCPMCSSLAVWANLSAICFGASIEETARIGKSRIHISAIEVVKQSPVMMEIIPGILADECLELYRG
jgi:tRNA(Arg) A34 adenosine deaminase TadA